MKKLFCVLSTVFILAYSAVGSANSASDGNALLKACSDFVISASVNTPIDPASYMGIGYCLGMVQGLTSLNNVYQNMEGRDLFCLPKKGIQNGQGARIITKYMEDHPELLHREGTTLSILAFKEAFPCK